MPRIKSKKFTGVYYNELVNGDRSYSYIYKDLNGKAVRRNAGKKSEGITEKFVNELRSESINRLRHGIDPKENRKKKKNLNFEEVWNHFLDNKAMVDRRRDDFRGRWNKHMKPYFENTVSVGKIKDFRNKLLREENPLSPKSIDMMITAIGTACNYWNTIQNMKKNRGEQFEQQIVNIVPDLRADDNLHQTRKQKQSVDVNRLRFLSREEIVELKATLFDKPELNLFVHLSLCTGGRLGTIMQIKKKDIRDSKVHLINEKTGGGYYTGYIDGDTQEILDVLLPTLSNNDNVIQIEQRSLQRRLLRILNKQFNEGLDSKDTVSRVVVHTLRHTFASHLIMNGVNLTQVQELMNHSDIQTTMKYAHLAPDLGKNAVMELWS
jgi:integrase